MIIDLNERRKKQRRMIVAAHIANYITDFIRIYFKYRLRCWYYGLNVCDDNDMFMCDFIWDETLEEEAGL